MAKPYVESVEVGGVYRMGESADQIAVVRGLSLTPPLVLVDIYRRQLQSSPADGSTFRPLMGAEVESGPLFQKGGEKCLGR